MAYYKIGMNMLIKLKASLSDKSRRSEALGDAQEVAFVTDRVHLKAVRDDRRHLEAIEGELLHFWHSWNVFLTTNV